MNIEKLKRDLAACEDEYEDVCAECGGEIKNEGGISEELGIELIHYCTECGVTEGELVKKKVE